MGELPIDPRHGTHAPITGTPPLLPGTIRRTSTIDTNRDEAACPGLLFVTARARDLAVLPAGTPTALGEAAVRATVGYRDGARLLDIEAVPPAPGLAELIGAPVRSGFRAKALTAIPAEAEHATLLNLIIDDLPGAVLVSGYATSRGPNPPRKPMPRMLAQSDLCSGWREGGTIMLEIRRGAPPPVVTGPVAAPLETRHDPWAWHRLDPMGPNGMRRLRLLDLRPGEPTPILGYFRDSHLSFDAVHTSIHEYSLHGTVHDGIIESLEGRDHALPWLECPHAVASAGWLVGTPVADLRERVRQDFTGIDTCTHLNDMLRSLADIRVLAQLRAATMSTRATGQRATPRPAHGDLW